VFSALLAWFVFCAGPETYLLDSPELVAATVGLGVSHPPGHPAFHLLSWPFLLVPVGGLAFRVHLACGLWSAASGALVLLIADRSGWVANRRTLVAASLAALGVGLSQALLFQAIRAEVYSLNLFTTLVAWWAVCRPGPTRLRHWVVAAAALGIGLLNHHYLTLFTFPAFALRFAMSSPAGDRLRSLAAATTVGGAALMGYGYLLARGFAQAVPAWIWPVDANGLLWHVSAAAFQKTASRAAQVDPIAGFTSALNLMAESLTWPWLIGAALGLGLLIRRQPRLGLPLAVLVVCNLTTQILFDFDPANPDVLGYFMPAFAALGVLVCYALSVLAKYVPASPAGSLLLTTAGALALLVGAFVPSAPGRTRSLHDYYDSGLLLRELEQAPPETTVVTAYFETSFLWWNERAVHDARPDLHVLHRSWRTYPHFDQMLLTGDPSLARLLDDHPERGGLSVDALVELAGRRAVLLQPEELSTSSEALVSRPIGLFWQVVPASASAQLPPPSVDAFVATSSRVADSSRIAVDSQLRRNLVWAAYQHARLVCSTPEFAGQCPEFVEAGRALAPSDSMWDDLLAPR
jgi:hypothetical protein